jgi:hypothetical protein
VAETLGSFWRSDRDVAQRPQVERDVLAGAPVAAGEAPDQPAVLVDQAHRQTVDLELGEVVHIGPDLPGHPIDPGAQLVGLEGVVEAEHPLEVVMRRELGGEPPADELRRRVRSGQRGPALLDLLQLAEEPVEGGVVDGRRVQHVVAELVLAHRLDQLAVPRPQLWRERRALLYRRVLRQLVGPGHVPRLAASTDGREHAGARIAG